MKVILEEEYGKVNSNEFIKLFSDIHFSSLIVVDVQNDFLPGGPLAAEDGDSIIDNINNTMYNFRKNNLPVILTQDWHPENHYSFASTHNMEPFEEYSDYGIGPVLWPDHCIQDSPGSDFAIDLDVYHATSIIRKGYNQKIDSYSGFVENDYKTQTGLDGLLKSQYVDRVFICGLVYDYCVFFTALDAVKKGYETYLLTDLTQPVGVPEGSIHRATKQLYESGVYFIETHNLFTNA